MQHLFHALLLCLAAQHVIAQSQNDIRKAHSYSIAKDIVWVDKADVTLTMDILTPDTGKKSYPVFVIFHGGGWLINDKSIMDAMAQYVASHGEYVVCNVNYRLLSDNNNTVTMNQIIEDAFGAVLWIKEHIKKYRGDPRKLAVSGDSAGGHLAAMIITAGHRLESDGFNGSSLGFCPTYLPDRKHAESVARKKGMKVQAVVLNYPATDLYAACLGRTGDGSDAFESGNNVFWSIANAKPRGIFGDSLNAKDNEQFYKAVSPVYNIDESSIRESPPQFCAVGSKDNLTTPTMVRAYVEQLKKAGHHAEYWEHEGRPHAYLDTGSNEFLGTNFEKDAIVAIDRIILFLNDVFY